MKIIEGQLKGLVINYKEQEGTRVTTDKVRKAVFDVLKGLVNFEDLKVLDLFCGSGMYGLEAMSRGARSVVFIDESRKVAKQLKGNIKNIKILGYYDIKILNISYDKFINIVGAEHVLPDKRAQYIAPLQKYKFDLVFADPPYFSRQYGGTSDFDYQKFNKIYKILEKDGIFVLEYSSKVGIDDFFGLKKLAEKRYGDAKVSFFRKQK